MGQRSARAVSVDLDRDHVRVTLLQIGGPDAEAGHRAWGEVGHQHVGTVQQLVQDVAPCLGFQVERHRFLAAVGPDEVRSKPVDDFVVVAGEVSALGIFDFDDPRTEIGEYPGAHRRRDRLLQGHHGDARQRPSVFRHHITMPPSTGSTWPVM